MKDMFDKKYTDFLKDDDNPELYDLLGKILNKEQVIIDDLLSNNSQLSRAIPLQKIKMKNFLFERSNPYQTKGVILYNREGLVSNSHLTTDVFLLKDFVQSYRLNWALMGYARYNESEIRNPETLLIGNDSYYRVKNQIIGVTKSISTVSKDGLNPMDYNQGSNKFDDDDIIKLAKKIIESFPNANLAHLNSIVSKKVI